MIYGEGCIGVGKSTTLGLLADKMPGAVVYHEQARHAFLDSFYKDVANQVKPSSHAFALQFRVMTDRFRRHCEGWRYEWMTGNQTIHDRSLSGDWAFVEMLHDDGFIRDVDYRTYMDLRRVLMEQIVIHAPQLCLFFDASPAKCIERVRQRDRVYEVGVTEEYENKLREKYFSLIIPELEDMGTKVVIVDWEEIKPVDFILDLIKDSGVLRWGLEKLL